MKLISPDDLHLAVRAVEAGELAVLPTRRWYMICANALDSRACESIFAGKGRPRSKSLAYVIPQLTAADELFVMTSHAHQLASAFWPGDLAMILRWQDVGVGQRHEPVGVPNALVTLDPGLLGELARQCNVPIAATTANLSNVASTDAAGPAITVAEVQRFVAESGVDAAYCVDGGISPLAQHLTIVDCTTTEAKLVRGGVVHERAISAAIGGPQEQPAA